MKSGGAVVWVEGLWKSFGSLVVNEDVSIHVDYGEVVSVLGPNGAGKTTLLRQVYGELRPDRGGRVLVMGMSLGRPGGAVV
ncbi:ATP-binding cassette domain-containing protein [Vulcanisaeta distributa]|uniref:ATP-binding cassette domain-containing protein n=1 Tax=Vulcanisaeta distributa TaxID=164451 RepID=UPI000A904E19|nr:ATP-binding cassette domain-containing protein [Vulcanisaeta distributa]